MSCPEDGPWFDAWAEMKAQPARLSPASPSAGRAEVTPTLQVREQRLAWNLRLQLGCGAQGTSRGASCPVSKPGSARY